MSDNPNPESNDSSQDAPTEEATAPSSTSQGSSTSRPSDLAPGRAGLSWAPAYQGPVTEEVPRGTAQVDLSQLEYVQSLLHRRNRAIRMVLTLLLMGALSFNFLVLKQIHDAVLVNVDQARLAQIDLNDLTRVRIEALEAKIDELIELQRRHQVVSEPESTDEDGAEAAPVQAPGDEPVAP